MDDDNLNEKEVRYENIFLSILQNEEKIEPFLDAVFKFLYRRTDFFLIQENPQQAYGFPKGIAKQTVLKLFEKYDKCSKEKIKQKITSEISAPIATTPKLESYDFKNKNVENSSIKSDPKTVKDLNKQTNAVQSQANATGTSSIDTNQNVNNYLKEKQEYFQKCPESYNGAIRDKYSWAQSIKDIDVKIKVGTKIVKSKDVKVKIEKQFLQVQTKNDSNTFDNIIEEKLAWKIRPEESTWSLFPGDHIHINLEKVEERWWENLLENEEKLDVKNMNPEKPMHDLEPEAQAKIQQLMYDQHKKRLGLPTSEEEKYHDMLKKAWNAEGSPFAGTEFDPSRISIEDGNVTIK